MNKLRRFSDVGQTSGILLGNPSIFIQNLSLNFSIICANKWYFSGRHNPKLANRRMSEAILPSMAQAHYLSPVQPLPSSTHLPPSSHQFIQPQFHQSTNHPYSAQPPSYLTNQYTHSSPHAVPQLHPFNLQLPTPVHQVVFSSPNPHQFSSNPTLPVQAYSNKPYPVQYINHHPAQFDSAAQPPVAKLSTCSVPIRNTSTDALPHPPCGLNLAPVQPQEAGQLDLPVKFTSGNFCLV